MLRHAHIALSMAQRGTLTRMWDYSPGLVIALATLWCIAAFLVACIVHVHMSEKRTIAQRNAVLFDASRQTAKTINLRKVA